MALILKARHWISRCSDVIVLPNADRAEAFRNKNGILVSPMIVWNCPAKAEILECRRGECGHERIFYHGSINPLRLPMSVLGALLLLPHGTVFRFAGYSTEGHKDYIPFFLKEAKRLGLSGRVTYLGAFSSRKALLPMCAQADIGLAFMPMLSPDINMVTMVGASNKVFDYMACGLGVIVSALPEWKEAFIEPGLAVGCNPEHPQEIATAVSWFANNPEKFAIMRQRGRKRLLSEWNYEKQFEKVLSKMG